MKCLRALLAVILLATFCPSLAIARSTVPRPIPGAARWQAAGLGLFYGSAFGFALGSHIDRRVNEGGRSPDETAAGLMLGGALAGGLGGYMSTAQAAIEPGRLAFAGSAVLWGGMLTLGLRQWLELPDDARSPVLVGTTLGVVAWHLWDDMPVSRRMVALLDLAGLAGLIAGVAAMESGGGTVVVVDDEPPLLNPEFETVESRKVREGRALTIALGVALGLGVVTMWALNDREVAEPSATALHVAPQWSNGGPTGVVIAGDF